MIKKGLYSFTIFMLCLFVFVGSVSAETYVDQIAESEMIFEHEEYEAVRQAINSSVFLERTKIM